VWLGVPVSGNDKMRGFRRLELRTPGGTALPWVVNNTGSVYDWPEIIFAPDCARVAVHLGRYDPYTIVQTAEFAAYARGQRIAARYLDDRDPCVLSEYAYSDLCWLSPDRVEYRFSPPNPMRWRRVDVTRVRPTLGKPKRKPCKRR